MAEKIKELEGQYGYHPTWEQYKALEQERDEYWELTMGAFSIECESRKRAESAEAEVKRLTEVNSGLSELTQGMDYCAEESDKKVKDAESRLAKAQEFFIESCHKFCGDDSIELPNDIDCFECEAYPVYKALGGVL